MEKNRESNSPENQKAPTREEVLDALGRLSERGVFGRREFLRVMIALGILGVVGYLKYLRSENGHLFFKLLEMIKESRKSNENPNPNE